MTNIDTAFVTGMLKQAKESDRQLHKRAYGKRLTALLQRKGKLPMETKPTVGVSSFPKQADLRTELTAGLGALGGVGAGLTSQMPLATTIAGAGLGGLAGAVTGGNADPNKSHRGRNALLGALAGGAAGYGAHRFSKDVAVPWILQQGEKLQQPQGIELPASLMNVPDSISKQAEDTFLPWTLLQERLQDAGGGISGYLQRAGQGVSNLAHKGIETVGRGADAIRNTVDAGVEGVHGLANRAEDALFESPMERLVRHGKRDFSRFQESDLGKSLAKLLQGAKDLPQSHPGLTSGAVGAGVGGIAGALTGKSKNKETGEGGTRGRNALLGALLGGGAGLAAHEGFNSQPVQEAVLKARTSGIAPRAEYTPEPSQSNPLQLLKRLGIAPLNLDQNAPPSSLSVKPRF